MKLKKAELGLTAIIIAVTFLVGGILFSTGQIDTPKDTISVDFSETSIMDYKNDGQCNDGKQNKVSMTVNDTPNNEFRNFVPKDGDYIEIRYE